MENGKRSREKGGISVRYAIADKQSFYPSIHQSIKEEKRNQEVEELRGALI